MIELDLDEYLDLLCLVNGLYYPLENFMDKEQVESVLKDFKLPNVKDLSDFTLPITLRAQQSFKSAQVKDLVYQGKKIGRLKITSVYRLEMQDFFSLFETEDIRHPGLEKEIKRGMWRCGGEILIENLAGGGLLKKNCIRQEFSQQNPEIKTICGFQTRNAPHLAHEHLQRVSLEICDALFINPLSGWKKAGDFSNEAVFAGYEVMRNFYPKDRILIKPLQTAMRYAGPKEAVFHAIVRRNLGCTHFIIGRDHAGVGNYYDKYAAQDFAKQFKNLGIQLLLLKEPFFCQKCACIASEKNCCHTDKERTYISGTKIRESLLKGEIPPAFMMRDEVSKRLLSLEKIFN